MCLLLFYVGVVERGCGCRLMGALVVVGGVGGGRRAGW